MSRCLFQSLPKIAIWMNDPVSGRLNPLLLFLHGFLTAEHTQGELIDSGLHHGPKLPLHKTMLPGSPLQIVKADHGLFPLPFEAHRVAVLLRVLAPRVIFLYRVLPLKNIIPISLLLLAAGKRIGFVFHGVVSVAAALGGGAFGLLLGRCWTREDAPSALLSLYGFFLMSFKLLCSSLPPVRLLQTETERPRARWIRFLGLPPSTDGLGSCRAKSCCLVSARTALRFNWHMLLHLIYIMWLMIPLLNAPAPRLLSLSHMEKETAYYSQFFFSPSLSF